MAMNKFGGVNDMPDGFTKTSLGKRVYNLWFGMLRRCYDYQQLERKKGKSYSNVVVCDRWFYLKNFYEDIQLIIRVDAINSIKKEIDRVEDSREEYSSVNVSHIVFDVKEHIDVVMTKIKNAER